MLKLLRTATLLIILGCLVIFVVQNLATTEVAFLTWAITAPRALAFLLMFGLGLIFGYLVRTFHWEPFQRRRPAAAAEPASRADSSNPQ